MNVSSENRKLSVIEKSPTIAVVDDDPSVRRALKRLIKSTGFNVNTFATAQEFLDYANHESPDLIILDVRMPQMSGLELQEHLVCSGSKIPIIFITAHEDEVAYTLAIASGATAFLQKPFDPCQLGGGSDGESIFRKIAHALRGARTHENKRDKNVPPIDRRGFLTPQKVRRDA
jgi:FixJ family two-component response regulator